MPRTPSPRLLPDKLLSCGALVGEVHQTSCQLFIDVSHYPRVTIVVIILVVLAIFCWHEEPNAFRWLWAASWMMQPFSDFIFCGHVTCIEFCDSKEILYVPSQCTLDVRILALLGRLSLAFEFRVV